MWVKLDIVTHMYVGIFIFILCYLQPVQIVAWLWRDWDMFDKVAKHHSRGFVVLSVSLGTTTFILSVQGPDP